MDSAPPIDLSTTQVRRGVFISDLHLFSPRSAAVETQSQLARYQDANECIVLGGDIFDFRWSTKGNHVATLKAACNWLHELLAATGQSQVVFLPGNHDCHPTFLGELKLLAERESRFSWHDHHLQIDDSLFLHGDILDAGLSLTGLARYRSKFHHENSQSLISHRSYDVAVAMRIHKLVPRLRHAPRRTCNRLLHALRNTEVLDGKDIRRIFFGHTHVPIQGLEIDGIQFFNPGASLRHMQTNIHHFSFDKPSLSL